MSRCMLLRLATAGSSQAAFGLVGRSIRDLIAVGRAHDLRHLGRIRSLAVRGFFTSLIVGFAAVLAGCGLVEVEEALRQSEKVAARIDALRPVPPAPRLSVVRVIEGRPYVGLEPVAVDRRAALPVRFLADNAVTLPLRDGASEAVLAARIETAVGVAVRFVGRAPPSDDGAPPGPEVLGAAGGDSLSPDGGIWTGPLDVLLDSWADSAGYDWRYVAADERIEIVRWRTVVFRVHALAGKQNYSVSASTEDKSGGAGSNDLAVQSISAETEYDPWPEIEQQLKDLVGESARVSVATSSASVMVSGRPADLVRARAFLDYLNREVLRPVILSVYVYSVTFEREADFDLGLSFFLSSFLHRSLELSVARDTLSLIRPVAVTGGADTLLATVRALNRAGTVSRVLSADIPSLNGKPAQFFELFNEAYLREQRTTVTADTVQTQLVPGTVSSGFAVSYLPRITGPDEVLVRLFASLQDRPVFTTFSSANQTIQLPAFGSRVIQVTQKIGRGETLMVTGFSDHSTRAERAGTFAVDVPLPEGVRQARTERVEQVLLITAEIGAPLGISESEGAVF